MSRSIVLRVGLAALLLCACAPPRADSCTARGPYAGPQPVSAPLPAFGDALDPTKRVPEAVVQRLAAAYADAKPKLGAEAVAVSLWQPGVGYWSMHDGVDPGTPMWLASVGKLVTATVVLQLVERGDLELGATIEPWFPDLEGADQITVDDLLRHTSGIFSFNADPELQEGPPRYRDPAALLAIAERHPRDFCPGTDWNYSNTGYVMLAQIAEEVTGEPFGMLVQRRIAAPLELASLRLVLPDDPPSAMHRSSAPRPATVASVASVFGAGGIVGTSDDALALLHGYLGGKLLQRSTLEAATAAVIPMFGEPMAYGRGVMVIEVPDPQAPSHWVGHLGGAPSAKAVVVFDEARAAYIVVVLDAEGPAEALANALLKALGPAD